MIRVLQCVNDMHRSGLETMLMNYYRNIDRTKIQFDFLTHRPSPSDYDEEIKELGGRVFYAPRLFPQNYPAYFHYMKEFFKQHPEYKIMHSHIDSMSYLPLLAGKFAGIPVRIAHSHNTGIDKDFKYILKQFFRLQINHVSNVRLACSEDAGRYLFGSANFQRIPNAIETSDFLYNDVIRKKIREELHLQNHFVIGHVGRLSYQKNHDFLIDIFREIVKRREDVCLLLVGEGEKESVIRKRVSSYGLEDKVIFMGKRKDVADIYQAMDVFVLPSLFEGLGMVGIEAQFAGLPCFFSDRVPKEAMIGKNVQFLPLEAGPGLWADRIVRQKSLTDRTVNPESPEYERYDIKKSVKILEDTYHTLERYTDRLR